MNSKEEAELIKRMILERGLLPNPSTIETVELSDQIIHVDTIQKQLLDALSSLISRCDVMINGETNG